MESNKQCIRCKSTHPATNEYFFFRNKEKGWLSSWCKICTKEQKSIDRLKNNIQQNIRRGLKPCRVCGSSYKNKGAVYCEKCLKDSTRRKKKLDKAIYKSRLRKAMPKWADRKELKRIYSERPKGFDVDHIIPIRGEFVSGLHVPNNLQYLRSDLNMAKSNHYSLEHNGVK